MAKISIAVAPTFKATAKIPAPEGRTLAVEFVFKHRTTEELARWTADVAASGRSDAVAVMEMAEGWTNVEEPFTAESVEALCLNYHRAGAAIATAYVDELMQAKVGN